ncbi:MAG: hypothetical protein V3U03_06035, partial [Myxococcota bacterium]
MSRGRSLGLLLRQLTAHDAYVVRRAAAEAAAAALAVVGHRLPGAARAAAWLQPTSAAAQRALADRAHRRGDREAAAQHGAEAERLALNTLETTVLTTLRNSLAWRRSRVARGGASNAVDTRLASGDLEGAARAAGDAGGSAGSRVDGLLRVAAQALHAGRAELADSLLARARGLDPGRADVWRALGQAALAAADPQRACADLERARSLDPASVETLVSLGDACRSADPARSRTLWWLALERSPGCEAALLRLETAEDPDAQAAELELRPAVARAELSIGESFELALKVRVANGRAALYVLEPFGAGIDCDPRGRIALDAGTHELGVRVGANRPDAVNGGRPWSVRFALCSGGRTVAAQVEVAVPERDAGAVYYCVTEDHELYDERQATDVHTARATLVDKSRLAESIANQAGARWTHMVDVASLAAVEWAAQRSSRGEWPELSRACHEHLIDAVAGGNDLGLHVHAFHDPDSGVFCHGFDEERDRVTTRSEFLETPLPRRAFWSRAFPALGSVDEPGTRAWATWRGIGKLEALGRLGDPHFRVTLFRAGSFDFGDDAAERARSIELLCRLGVLADSDVPKPRLYHRVLSPSAYPISRDPRSPEPDPERFRLLEIRAEFNVEADFLSDVHVLNAYV